MYFYNSKAVDSVYNPLPPPAAGFDFLQGPKVPGSVTDRAIFKGKSVNGFKNLPMTGFYFFINSDPIYNDPASANYNTGTLEWYNLFRSRISTNGQPFTDPNTGKITMYPLAGDPVTGSGWIDGQLNKPADGRGGMTSGPFTMAYGDTQEVIVSEMCAGATTGIDRFSAVILLKQYDLDAQQAYNDFFNIPTGIENNLNIPTRYSLSQNYPNPFNPTTKIKFNIPKQTHAKLVVYDILGRELEKLVDKEMQSGSYEVIFDGKNLPSGVYFYRITTKEFSQTKKFVLMK
jgi:hypothetical protein